GGTADAPGAGSGGDSVEGAAPAGGSPPMLVEADFTVGRLVARQATLTDAKGSVLMDGGFTQLHLEEGKLNDGPIRGEAEYDVGRREPSMAWNMTMEKANVENLIATLAPKLQGRLSGTMDLVTRGSGKGTGADLKRRLQGDVDFKIADGQVANLE